MDFTKIYQFSIITTILPIFTKKSKIILKKIKILMLITILLIDLQFI